MDEHFSKFSGQFSTRNSLMGDMKLFNSLVVFHALYNFYWAVWILLFEEFLGKNMCTFLRCDVYEKKKIIEKYVKKIFMKSGKIFPWKLTIPTGPSSHTMTKIWLLKPITKSKKSCESYQHSSIYVVKSVSNFEILLDQYNWR